MFLYELYVDLPVAWSRSTHHGSLGQRFEVQNRLGDHIPEQSDHHPAQLLIPHLDIEVNLDDTRESGLIAWNRYTTFAVVTWRFLPNYGTAYRKTNWSVYFILQYFSANCYWEHRIKKGIQKFTKIMRYNYTKEPPVQFPYIRNILCNCGHFPHLLNK